MLLALAFSTGCSTGPASGVATESVAGHGARLTFYVPKNAVMMACVEAKDNDELADMLKNTNSSGVFYVLIPDAKSPGGYEITGLDGMIENRTNEVIIPANYPFVGNFRREVCLAVDGTIRCFAFGYSPDFKDYIEFGVGTVQTFKGKTYFLMEETTCELENPELYRRLLDHDAKVAPK